MPWGAGVPGPAPPLLLSEADGRVNPARAVPSPRGPRSASRWDKPTMGREIKELALHPAPNFGLFLSQGRSFSLWGSRPGSVFSIQQIQR